MTSEKNHQNHNEIDLSQIIITIWNNKLKIFLITVLSIIIMYVYQISKEPVKLLYNAKIEIRPISTFDEARYAFYNSYLEKLNKRGFFLETEAIKDKDYSPSFSNLLIINKKILINLFIDKLNQNSTFIEAIKKFELIKKEDYPDNSEYEIAVIKLASSIRLLAPNDNKVYWNINLQIQDYQNLENFFKLVEKKANQEIQLYLENTLKNQIINQKKLIKFEIEDINLQLTNNLEDFNKVIELIVDPIEKDAYIKQINNLKIKRNFLTSSKDVERFEDILEDSPITNSNKFYAAKLMVDSMEIKKLVKEEYSLSKKLIFSAILGLILGVLFVMVSRVINTKNL